MKYKQIHVPRDVWQQCESIAKEKGLLPAQYLVSIMRIGLRQNQVAPEPEVEPVIKPEVEPVIKPEVEPVIKPEVEPEEDNPEF